MWDPREREPVKLSLLHHPLCCSFRYYDAGSMVLVDATAAEEKISEGELVISMNRFGEVCHMAKYGGITVDAVTMLGWMRVAAEKVRDLSKLIQDRLAEDERKRDVGGLIAELSAENER